MLRIDIDPARELTAGQRAAGLTALRTELADLDAELLEPHLPSADRLDVDPPGAMPAAALPGAKQPGTDRPGTDRRAGGRLDVDPVDSRQPGGDIRGVDAATPAPSSGVQAAPPRELQFLVDTDDAAASLAALVIVCAKVFGTDPRPGVVTYVSRGTDDDAHGVLAGFGLRGEVTRSLDDDGFDIVRVRLREEDLRRVPESRIHTALEASLNCEVRLDIR